jgi:ribosomal protein L37AE/L43A
MAITLTDRIVSRFGPRSRPLNPARSRVQCPDCGTTNRRTLERGDDRCWNCDAELPRQDMTARS